MYSLSTCWNSSRHIDGRAMLGEIRDLGFECAELSHGIRLSLVPGILDAVDAGEIKISSLHNYCPLPIGITSAAPNIFLFTASDRRESDNAYRHTVKTLDLAQRVKAAVVVLHLGQIDMKDYTHRLIEMAGDGQRDTPKFQKLCAEADEKREAKKEKYLQPAYDLLHRLEEQAALRGVVLGVENRECLEELPLDSDFPFLLREFAGGTVRYWHDTGHAQIKENLGFIQQLMQVESLVEDLAGFHLHDTEFPGADHLPPGKGKVDFAALKPLVKPEQLKVFELSPSVTVEELQAGVAHLKGLWGEA
jgi:sugar phosphate isomerase/epimerase